MIDAKCIYLELRVPLAYETVYDCYVIGLLYNNNVVVAYTTLLTVWLQVCFWMNILQTKCATYNYGLYTQSACLWVWLILTIIHDPIGHHYYTHTFIFDDISSWEEYWPYTIHPIPFTKTHCHLKPLCFLWLTFIILTLCCLSLSLLFSFIALWLLTQCHGAKNVRLKLLSMIQN